MKTLILLLPILIFSFNGMAQTDREQEKRLGTEVTVQPKVKVFPNPATSVVNILGLSNTNRAEITVSDVYGNIVLQHRWAVRNHAVNIPISDLHPGIYIIAIRSEEQQVQTKFYKQ
ncbi:T9SS type A sorting domain-containing protein [Flavobacteriaceae bacterium TP-CH-4]|uniref:T9SS type A sorting domain-containing protein n=1 Tax=Pelagihabitans pacificus TaxID=2696054 RepID=A0A967E4H5_9FLAO|nr:T9SS type A sorting domain-containing protein [Pelagihabitans pacificus]NHF58397.1 T9SS type A sorting domain-containing protein [Pelagihabitans pacificus]